MQIIDIIKYDGNSNEKQWLIYKYSSDQFVLGSQLIVNEGQEAMFFKGGKALDLFRPGTYILSTGNLPLLKEFLKVLMGGKTPFSAEVYFINKTVNLNMKWGTATQIPIEDPKYGIILDIMARGQYGIVIKDSRLFVSRIIGAVPMGTERDYLIISRYFNSMINTKIKSVLTKFMIMRRISFLEITQYLSELSDVFKEEVEMEFERFGIEIVNFYCDSIGPKAEDYKKLREYKENILFSSGSITIGRRCPVCGNDIYDSMKFCSNCGVKL